MYQYPDVPDPMKQIRRRTLGGAAFVTIAGLLLGEVITLLAFGFLPEPRELYEAYVLHLAAFVFVFWWVTQYIFEVALYNMEVAFEDCERLREREERRRNPNFVTMNSEMKNHVSLAVDNNKMTPLSKYHAQKLCQVLKRRDWKISKRALKAEGVDGKHFVNIDSRYGNMMANWNKWGWLVGYTADLNGAMYLSEKGQAELLERAGMHAASPT